jgi:hypothetical protein
MGLSRTYKGREASGSQEVAERKPDKASTDRENTYPFSGPQSVCDWLRMVVSLQMMRQAWETFPSVGERVTLFQPKALHDCNSKH